jgi:pimeloyl-ACP methyl ester carboxylesterase
MSFVEIADARLEVATIDAARPGSPTLVLLHEGLGSVALWRDFPSHVAAATSARTIAYSRRGYGRSSPIAGPRAVDYMHREALDVLPVLLDRLDATAPVLVGHSDGASISIIHAAASGRPVRGVVLIAPHVFVEDLTVSSIEEAKAAWAATDLKQRLARYHDDVEGAFRSWNDIWLDPDFRSWNIEAYLPRLRCPVLAIQGADDEYGTLAQIDAVARQVGGPVETLVLQGCKHSPHRDRPAETLEAITAFVDGLR